MQTEKVVLDINVWDFRFIRYLCIMMIMFLRWQFHLIDKGRNQAFYFVSLGVFASILSPSSSLPEQPN